MSDKTQQLIGNTLFFALGIGTTLERNNILSNIINMHLVNFLGVTATMKRSLETKQ